MILLMATVAVLALLSGTVTLVASHTALLIAALVSAWLLAYAAHVMVSHRRGDQPERAASASHASEGNS